MINRRKSGTPRRRRGSSPVTAHDTCGAGDANSTDIAGATDSVGRPMRAADRAEGRKSVADNDRSDVRRFAGDPIASPALLAGIAWSGTRQHR